MRGRNSIIIGRLCFGLLSVLWVKYLAKRAERGKVWDRSSTTIYHEPYRAFLAGFYDQSWSVKKWVVALQEVGGWPRGSCSDGGLWQRPRVAVLVRRTDAGNTRVASVWMPRWMCTRTLGDAVVMLGIDAKNNARTFMSLIYVQS